MRSRARELSLIHISAGKAAHLAEHQLGQGRAVHAAALFLQDLQDDGVGQGLDGKILLEADVYKRQILYKPQGFLGV